MYRVLSFAHKTKFRLIFAKSIGDESNRSLSIMIESITEKFYYICNFYINHVVINSMIISRCVTRTII